VLCTEDEAPAWTPENFLLSRPDSRNAITDPYQYPSDLATISCAREIAGMESTNLQQDRDCDLEYTWAVPAKDHACCQWHCGAAYSPNLAHMCATQSRGITPSQQQLEAREAGTTPVDTSGNHEDDVTFSGSHAVRTDGATSYGVALIHVPAGELDDGD